MTADLSSTKTEDRKPQVKVQGGSSGSVYGIGLFGAWAYYIGRATTTQERIRGFFKGLVWPAFLVYDALKFLNKE